MSAQTQTTGQWGNQTPPRDRGITHLRKVGDTHTLCGVPVAVVMPEGTLATCVVCVDLFDVMRAKAGKGKGK